MAQAVNVVLTEPEYKPFWQSIPGFVKLQGKAPNCQRKTRRTRMEWIHKHKTQIRILSQFLKILFPPMFPIQLWNMSKKA
jgi:hypothetical protein